MPISVPSKAFYSLSQFATKYKLLSDQVDDLAKKISAQPMNKRMPFERAIDTLNLTQTSLASRIKLISSKDRIHATTMIKEMEKSMQALDQMLYSAAPVPQSLGGFIAQNIISGIVAGTISHAIDYALKPVLTSQPPPIDPAECTYHSTEWFTQHGIDGEPDLLVMRKMGLHPSSNVPVVMKTVAVEKTGIPSELTDDEAFWLNRLAPEIPEGTTVTLCGYGDPNGRMAGETDNSAYDTWAEQQDKWIRDLYENCYTDGSRRTNWSLDPRWQKAEYARIMGDALKKTPRSTGIIALPRWEVLKRMNRVMNFSLL